MQEIYQRLKDKKLIMVIGQVDTGKTTLVWQLAKEFFEDKKKVAIVDADIGQSEIGPPTCIGWKFYNTKDNFCGIYFVGNTTPEGNIIECLIGTKKMVEDAFYNGAEVVLVDTTGLVYGNIGRTLKYFKFQLLSPDVVLAIQKKDELEHILKWIDEKRIIRISPLPDVKEKDKQMRKYRRENKFKEYFNQTKQVNISCKDVRLIGEDLFYGLALNQTEVITLSELLKEEVIWAERLKNDTLLVVTKDPVNKFFFNNPLKDLGYKEINCKALVEFESVLVGLNDSNKDIGIGILKGIDFSNKSFLCKIPIFIDETKIKALKFSKFKVSF